jgi:ATP-dependent DNA helicase RecQ
LQKNYVSIVNSIAMEDGSIVVLKGFPVSVFDYSKPCLEKVVESPFERFMEIMNGQQRVITFEEFVVLHTFVIQAFKKITIVENSIFLNLFPVDVELAKEKLNQLISHYSEEDETEVKLSEILSLTDVYSNVFKTELGVGCCYNISDNMLKHEKIDIIRVTEVEEYKDVAASADFQSICNEIDYYQFVQKLKLTNGKLIVSWENFALGREIIERKIVLLDKLFPTRIQKSVIAPISKEADFPEIYTYLKRYWNYSSFKNIDIYNKEDLDKKIKTVETISQENIINEIITQSKLCAESQDFDDVFVTAPTGAGKSLMFQIPAMYLAEKYNKVTIVISPLIGLMNDQVNELDSNGYSYSRTINSDIPPILKQEICEDVANGKCHILYISPETLLSRSDIQQLIGNRRIGLLVVDEAHITTTWGKQFRPDYWYLGDHVKKLRRDQAKKETDPCQFVISTFTATAIYEGTEDMYHETINSLHMRGPKTFLGYLKRENISIEVTKVETKTNKFEYEKDKFDLLVAGIEKALIRNQKMLIYFPTVALINRFYDYCYSKNLSNYVSKYHGQLKPSNKNENFQAFLMGEKMIMLATKAFGMGINIPDISIVSHYAPTGNVCDYMQEIGRAARRPNIKGHATYNYMRNDFKHINRLHGLSAIRKYQLVEVIKKVHELYLEHRYKKNGKNFTKKRNEMLVDAECFSYIFEGPTSKDDNDMTNKVKTAMLLIQKDYENRGFAPFYMRPMPLFAFGYFYMAKRTYIDVQSRYGDVAKLVCFQKNIYEVNLQKIWEKDYYNSMSFPNFKYLLYTNSEELTFNEKFTIKPAISIDIREENNADILYQKCVLALKKIVNESQKDGSYIYTERMIEIFASFVGVSKFKAEGIVDVFIAVLETFQKDFSGRMQAKVFNSRATKDGKISYQFSVRTNEFFGWMNKTYKYVMENVEDTKLYACDGNGESIKEITTVLGMLETFEVLSFKSLGGSNSQLYIYVNETKNMQMVKDKPWTYKNKLLDMINVRHNDSVKMLSYLFDNDFSNEKLWEHLENYFLGILPEDLEFKNIPKIEDYEDKSVSVQIGSSLSADYANWKEANVLFEKEQIEYFDEYNIPLADYYAGKLFLGDMEINANLIWYSEKIAITSGEETENTRAIFMDNGWKCYTIDDSDFTNLRLEIGDLKNG